MIIYWHPTGPQIAHTDGLLVVEDLNPEIRTQWRMSRVEMLMMGLRCVLSAIRLGRTAAAAKPAPMR